MSIEGKTALVTGATSGIGRAIAAGLARHGAAVTITARDRARGEAAASEIRAETGNQNVEVLLADLASQGSIRALAEQFRQGHPALNVLVNDAAVFMSRREISPDGLEMTFAVNHLGYFLLTHLLLDALKAGAPSAVVNVTAPSTTRPDFDDLQGKRRFSAAEAFGASKMCNLLFSYALARRLEGSGVRVFAYHPGLVKSGLMRGAPAPMRLVGGLVNLFAIPAERAVDGVAALAENPHGAAGGVFYHGEKPIAPPAYALDEAAQERLWAESARLVGL